MHTRAKLTPVTRAALRHRPSSSGRRAGRRWLSSYRPSRLRRPRFPRQRAANQLGGLLRRRPAHPMRPSLRHPTVLHHAPSRAGGSPKPGTTSNAPGSMFRRSARGADGFGGLDPGPARRLLPALRRHRRARPRSTTASAKPAAPEKSLARRGSGSSDSASTSRAEPVGLRSEVHALAPSRARSRPLSATPSPRRWSKPDFADAKPIIVPVPISLRRRPRARNRSHARRRPRRGRPHRRQDRPAAQARPSPLANPRRASRREATSQLDPPPRHLAPAAPGRPADHRRGRRLDDHRTIRAACRGVLNFCEISGHHRN